MYSHDERKDARENAKRNNNRPIIHPRRRFVFDFDKDDLAPKSTPVKYRGKKYVLKEADNAAAVAYRNATSKATRLVDGKLSGFDGLHDADPLLVSMCLYEVDATGPGTEGKVAIGFVKGMLNKYVKPMFEWVVENSDLKETPTKEGVEKQIAELQKQLAAMDEKEPDGPKDEPTTTTPTSD